MESKYLGWAGSWREKQACGCILNTRKCILFLFLFLYLSRADVLLNSIKLTPFVVRVMHGIPV